MNNHEENNEKNFQSEQLAVQIEELRSLLEEQKKQGRDERERLERLEKLEHDLKTSVDALQKILGQNVSFFAQDSSAGSEERHVQTESKYRDYEQITYSRIAQSLSKDFFNIFYVNLENDSFVKFLLNNEKSTLNIEKTGEDFFNNTRKQFPHLIYPEDQVKLLTAFSKKSILAELEKGYPFSISCRMMLNKKPRHVMLKANYMTGDRSHIVIGVTNNDTQMKREMNFARAIGNTRDMVNRDALTGVKSKHAYLETEKHINEQIAHQPDDTEFAVAICDVLNTEEIGESFDNGERDRLIKSASSIICNIFKHSPVFRIDTNRFVSILQGKDFYTKDLLLEALSKRVGAAKKADKVVIAAGLGLYEAGNDHSISEVYNRAEKAIEENKKSL